MKKLKLPKEKKPKLPKISKVKPAKVKPIKMGGPPPSAGRGRRKKDML